jgi:hypothetical protein
MRSSNGNSKPKRPALQRRKFLQTSVVAAGAVGAAGVSAAGATAAPDRPGSPRALVRHSRDYNSRMSGII